MNDKYILVGLLAAIVGCTPGEAEFTLKTSEVRKALQGEVGRVQVHQQFCLDMSNEYHHVISGQKVLTNDVEVTRQLLEETGFAKGCPVWSAGHSNFLVRTWIDQGTNLWPMLHVDAHTEVLLCSTNRFESVGEGVFAARNQAVDCLTIEPDSGVVQDTQDMFNLDGVMVWSCRAYCEGLARGLSISSGSPYDFTKDFGSRFGVLAEMFEELSAPTRMDERSCVVIGDCDEPLYVEATSAIVDGKYYSSYRACVRKGDRIAFSLKSGVRGPLGRVRLSLVPLNATE